MLVSSNVINNKFSPNSRQSMLLRLHIAYSRQQTHFLSISGCQVNIMQLTIMEIGKLSNSEDTILTKIIFVKILTATNM